MQAAMRLAPAALILALVSPEPAMAQAPPPEVDPPAEPEEEEPLEVRVIGDKADAMQKVPGSATIIRPREIDRAQPYDAAEMLRRVPGVQVRQDPGAGGRLDIGVRGLDPGRSRRVLILEDGVPIAINPYAEPDLYHQPPIERMRAIEVVKGSGSILFGPQTVGGVINFITLFPPSGREVTLEAKGGERGFFQALGRYGDAFGSARYVTQLLFRRGDGFRDQGFTTIDALGKLAFDTGPRGEATIKIGLHDNAADADDVGLTPAMYAQDPRRPTLAPHDHLHLRRYEIALIHDHRFDEIVSLRTLAYAYTTARIWRRQDFDRFPVGGVAYQRIVGDVSVPGGAIYFRDTNTILDRDHQVAGLEPRLELRFPTGDVGHTVDVGARILGEGAQYELRQGDTPVSEAGSLELDESRSSIAVAAYLQDRIAFLDESLLVTPGVRIEHVRYQRDVARQPAPGGARDVAIENRSDATALVPGIGMTAGRPDIHAFAGFHVGFAPPRVAATVNPQRENEELEAERNLSYELGVRLDKGIVDAEITGFLSNFQNQIVATTVGGVTTLVNGGATRHAGVETGAIVAFGDLIGHGMFVDLSPRYTFVQAHFVVGPSEGNALPYAPEHTVSTTLDVGHALGVGAQLSHTYVGPQYADDANTEAENITGELGRIPGYHTLDAGVRYRHEPSGLSASVVVKNLPNQPYVVARRPQGIFVGGLRQIVGTLRWDYR
jgi:Fe(3+) dicitrate transport protein